MHLELNISKTAGDAIYQQSLITGPPIGNGHGESNCHVTDHVTWPWKVTVVTPMHLELNVAGDAIYQQSLITAVRQYGRLS